MSNKKKKIAVIMLSIFAVILVIGATYAFVTRTLTGTKGVVINAGTLDLVLEEENAITISDALPMYDEVGMIQEDVFEFRLVNKTSNDTNYVLKLVKIDSDNELSTSDVKYYLTKDGVGEPALLSTLTDGVVDTGTIVGNDTIDYTLRLWIDSSVTSNEVITGKILSYRIDVEVGQKEFVVNDDVVLFSWDSNTTYLETVEFSFDGTPVYFYKVSDKVYEQEEWIGASGKTVIDGQEISNTLTVDDIRALTLTEGNIVDVYGYTVASLIYVIHEDFDGPGGLSLTSGTWVTSLNESYSISNATITITKEQALERENILFEWYPEKIAYDTWEDSVGDTIYRFSTKPLPRMNELIGSKIISDKIDGTVEEIVLREDIMYEDDTDTSLAYFLLFSVFKDGGSFVGGTEVPVGTYMINVDTADAVRIRLVKE